MTDEDADLSRRQWRDKHERPIRRGDPVFDLASWVIPVASLAMFLASFGGKSSRLLATPDESAVWVVVCAALIGLLLIVVAVRLLCKRGRAPLSVAGAVFVVVVSLLSMVVVLARNEGALSTPIILMIVTNAVCLLAGFVALAIPVIRRPAAETEE